MNVFYWYGNWKALETIFSKIADTGLYSSVRVYIDNSWKLHKQYKTITAQLRYLAIIIGLPTQEEIYLNLITSFKRP